MTGMTRAARLLCSCGLLTLTSTPALAHSEATGSGLLAGLLHPLTGADHFLAMLAVGVVSVRRGGSNIWRVPAAFVGAMVAGAWLGFVGWTVPAAEVGVAVSVLLLGLAVALPPVTAQAREPSFKRTAGAVFVTVFLFGLCHGYAHGVELPRTAVPVFYSTGFIIATVFIHVCGIVVGEVASGAPGLDIALRVSGLIMAGVGVWFVWR